LNLVHFHHSHGEEDMLRDDFTQFMVEKDNALCFMEIKHSKFHTRSLLSSNLNIDTSHFEMINLTLKETFKPMI
jgi:hypothetical protein